MTSNYLARVKLIAEQAAAGIITNETAIHQILALLDYISATEIVAEYTAPVSAEQLSIALMAEARRMYDGGEVGSHLELADRLSNWASDLRQLGVQHFTETSRLNRMLGEARNEVNALEGKFDDIYSICAKPGYAFAVRRIREVLDRE